MARVWDNFLTEQDKLHLRASSPKREYGYGNRAAVLSVDNYRAGIGDEREPLLESIKKWPSSTGEQGWDAVEAIAKIFASARSAGVPIIHVTALRKEETGMPRWGESLGGRHSVVPKSSEEQDRYDRQHDFVEQASPIEGEVVFKKSAPSAFFGTPLAPYLISTGIDTLIVCGQSVSGCVRATVVDGRSYRFRMIVVEEAVYDRHQATRAMNLFDMDQKYADVVSLESAIAWLDARR